MIETPTSGEYILQGNNCFNLSQNLKTKLEESLLDIYFKIISY